MMRAVIWEAPGQLEITEAADPAPQHGELIIQVGICGICGTDLHIADGEFPPTPYPIIPGHEFAGRIVARGGGVPGDWPEGARVAVDPSLFCGHCPACRSGRGNLCANWNAIGDTVNGAFAEYVAVPAANAYRIPDSVDDAQGALIEPLSCAVHGLRRLGPVVGEDVLLIGAGTMGLLLLQLLNDAGARSVSVVDRKAARLAAAEAVGAASVAEDVSALDHGPFGVAVDATGAPAAIEAAFTALDRGGRRGRQRVAVPVPHLQRRDHRARVDGRAEQLRRGCRPDGSGHHPDEPAAEPPVCPGPVPRGAGQRPPRRGHQAPGGAGGLSIPHPPQPGRPAGGSADQAGD